MVEMVGFLRSALEERLESNAWMDANTREAAKEKLHKFTAKVGYPDKWRDFTSLKISPGDLVGNVRRILEFERADRRAKLASPGRKWEWLMPAAIVNAYYASRTNEIVFPAGILQPPFFDPKADPAVNFGSIGMVIGHEMGHGFDDQGSRNDGDGRLRDWWSAEARASFDTLGSRLAARFDAYSPLEGVNLNGKLTLGENIGDLCGISVAYSAYMKYKATKGEGPVLDGFTGEQRFFMGFAQLWRAIMTEPVVRQLALVDPHSPGRFRVNGALRNFSPWYEAYKVSETSPFFLAEKDRIVMW